MKKYLGYIISFGLGVVVGALFFSTKKTITNYISSSSGEDLTEELKKLEGTGTKINIISGSSASAK